MTQTPKVAVLGAGRWGMNHVRNFHALGALAAVVDPDPKAAARVAEAGVSAPVYPSLNVALDAAAFDGVVIATPAPRHREDALAAIAAGKDVLVEKPMTLDTAEAEAICEAAEAAGRLVMVGHLLLYQPAIAWIREQIAAGAIGKVRHVEARRLNLGTVRPNENVFWSFSPHDLAVVHHLIGEPALERVQAFGQAAVQPGVEDLVHADFVFDGGITAHVQASWFWPVLIRTTTVVGSTGAIVYDEVAQKVTLHRTSIDPSTLATSRGEPVEAPVADAQPLKLECQHFLDCIASRAQPRSHGRHGVEVVRMLELATTEAHGV